MDEQPVSRRSLWAVRIVVFFSVLIPIALGFVLLVNATGGIGASQSSGQIALQYARQNLVWNSGPYLKGTYSTTVGALRQTLMHHTPVHVANDVNVSQLVHTYGAGRRVDLVVLSGVFNTLPPDEGITGPGTIVVLVDPAKHRAFYNNF